MWSSRVFGVRRKKKDVFEREKEHAHPHAHSHERALYALRGNPNLLYWSRFHHSAAAKMRRVREDQEEERENAYSYVLYHCTVSM